MALFTRLPDEFFRPLAGPSRRLHAALLPHLARRVFASAGVVPRREEVLVEIGAFLEGIGAGRDGPDPDLDKYGDPDRRSAVLRFLTDTGWLVEHRDRYLRSVDLDPDARIVLDALTALEASGAQSYGGTILDVLGALEAAQAHPDARSESIRSAGRSARAFERSLRAVEAAMRKAEARVISAETPALAFRAWFEGFVEQHLISDFKTLRTRDNPFRFRMQAARLAIRIGADEPLMLRLAEGWVREGRSAGVDAAVTAIAAELQEVAAVLDRLDGHLQAIDDTVARLEKRITLALRFMDRISQGRSVRIADVVAAVAATDVPATAEIDVLPPLTAFGLPLGPSHVFSPPRPRSIIKPPRVEVRDPDPQMVAWLQARTRFQAMCVVTEPRMRDFIESCLGDRETMTAAEITIRDVADFVLFQRLREVPLLWDGRLARSFVVETLPGRIDNGWISCRDFKISRRMRTAA